MESDRSATNVVDVIVSIIGLFRYALWPAAVLFIFLSIQVPLVKLLERAPNLVDRANVITIGGISVNLGEAASVPTDGRFELILRQLSPDAVKLLLEQWEGSRRTCWASDESRQTYSLFSELNLINFLDLSAEDRKEVENDPLYTGIQLEDCIKYELSDLGKQTQDFLINFIAQGIGGPNE